MTLRSFSVSLAGDTPDFELDADWKEPWDDLSEEDLCDEDVADDALVWLEIDRSLVSELTASCGCTARDGDLVGPSSRKPSRKLS